MSATQTSEKDMPRVLGLVLRKGRYNYRARLPQDLVGKVKGRHRGWGTEEIFFALGTSDRKKAVRLARQAVGELDDLFDEERERLQREEFPKVEPKKLTTLSDRRVKRLVTQWFKEVHEQSVDWYNSKGVHLSEEERKEALENVEDSLSYYTGQDLHGYEETDAKGYLDSFLEKENLQIEKESEAYQTLNKLFRMGAVELHREEMARLNRQPAEKYDRYFLQYYRPETLNQKDEETTLKELITSFKNGLPHEFSNMGVLS